MIRISTTNNRISPITVLIGDNEEGLDTKAAKFGLDRISNLQGAPVYLVTGEKAKELAFSGIKEATQPEIDQIKAKFANLKKPIGDKQS